MPADKTWAKNQTHCKICDWHGSKDDLLIAMHPFQRGEVVSGCPNCRNVIAEQAKQAPTSESEGKGDTYHA